jgi:predicted Zn-dependent protease
MGRHAELRSAGRDTRSLDFLSSHPMAPERIKNAVESARNLTGAPKGDRDKAAYLRGIDGMRYGGNADDGFVQGRRFIHPSRGFTFIAPEGVNLDSAAGDAAHVVAGRSEEGAGLALHLDAVRVPPDRTLIEYLNSGWIENIEDGSVEELLVNGMPAATAIATSDASANSLASATSARWRFRVYVIRFDSDVYRFIFAVRMPDMADGRELDRAFPEADRLFRESIQTFRKLSALEKAMQPLRLKIVKAQPGDTVESLAAGMPFADDHRTERFRILNGLDAQDELKAGDLVKIVVE